MASRTWSPLSWQGGEFPVREGLLLHPGRSGDVPVLAAPGQHCSPWQRRELAAEVPAI